MKDTFCGSWWTPSRGRWRWRCNWPHATRPVNSWSPPLRWRASRCGKWSWSWKGMTMSILEDLGRSRKVLEYLGISWYFKAVKDLYFYTILPGPWWSWMWRCVTVAKMRYNMVQLYEQDDLQRRSAEFSHDNIIQHPRQIVAQSKLDLLIWIPTFPTTILLYYLLLSHLTVLLKDACCVHLSRCLSHTEHTVIEKHRFEVYRWSLINPSKVFLLQCVLGHSALLPYRHSGTSPWTSQWTCLFHQNPMKAAVPPPKLAWKLQIRLDMAWKSWGFLFKLQGVPLHNDISQWEIEQNEGLGFNMFEREHHPRYSISMYQWV